MDEKANDRWKDVRRYVMELWPEIHKKHWSPAVDEAWRERVGHLPLDHVISALKYWATEKPYFPKAGELFLFIHHRTRDPRQPDNATDELWTREEYNQHWATIKARVLSLPVEELEQHKATELAHDWRRRFMEKYPVTWNGWLTIINHRLKLGLGPDEREDRDIPPLPQSRQGNLVDCIQMPQGPPALSFDGDGYPEI